MLTFVVHCEFLSIPEGKSSMTFVSPDPSSNFHGGDNGLRCSLTENTSAGFERISFTSGTTVNGLPAILGEEAFAATFSLGDVSLVLPRTISVEPQREVEAVSIRHVLKSDPERAMKLFNDCYDVYVKAFPDPDEIQSPEGLLRDLKKEAPLWDMVAVLEGKRVLGACHFTLLQSNHPEIGLFVAVEHIYVDQSERQQGLGRTLLAHTEELMRAWGVKVAIAEQNDPHAMSPELLAFDAESGVSSRQRLSFWKKRGYEGIDAPYVQPPLEEGKAAVYHLRIAIRRLDPSVPDSLPVEGYIQMLKAYQSGWVNDIDSNPLVNQYCDAIRREHPQRVPIIDLEEPRTCVKGRSFD